MNFDFFSESTPPFKSVLEAVNNRHIEELNRLYSFYETLNFPEVLHNTSNLAEFDKYLEEKERPFCLAGIELVEKSDKDGLNFLVSSGITITSIACYAAFYGKIDVLRKLTNEFKININLVAYALAKRGNKDDVKEFMKGRDLNVVLWIILGFAIRGDKISAEEFRVEICGLNSLNLVAKFVAQYGLREYAEDLRQKGAHPKDIAQGAARGGHRDYAEWLRENHQASVNDIACGAAQGGHKEYAEQLRIEHHAKVNHIARGAAQGGHRDYAEWLRENHHASVNDIARGAARGGHRDYAEWLHQQHGANLKHIACGAAEGGHIEYAKSLTSQRGIDKPTLQDIMVSAIQGGYTVEIVRLSTQPLVWNEFPNFWHLIAKGAAQGGYLNYGLSLVRQQNALLRYVVEGAANGGCEVFLDNLQNLWEDKESVRKCIYAAARRGYLELAQKLCNPDKIKAYDKSFQSRCKKSLLQGAAEGGYITKELENFCFNVLDVREYYRNKWIAIGAAKGCHKKDVNLLSIPPSEISNFLKEVNQSGHSRYVQELEREIVELSEKHIKYKPFIQGFNNALVNQSSMMVGTSELIGGFDLQLNRKDSRSAVASGPALCDTRRSREISTQEEPLPKRIRLSVASEKSEVVEPEEDHNFVQEETVVNSLFQDDVSETRTVEGSLIGMFRRSVRNVDRPQAVEVKPEPVNEAPLTSFQDDVSEMGTVEGSLMGMFRRSVRNVDSSQAGEIKPEPVNEAPLPSYNRP